MVSLLSEKQNCKWLLYPGTKFTHMAIDHAYELTGQILDCLFSWFIIGKLTSLSVNYKLIDV